MKLHFIERVFYACITVCSAVVESSVFGSVAKRLDCYDHEVFIMSGQVTLGILNLIEPLEPALISDLKPHEFRHILFDKSFPSKLTKSLQSEVEIEKREYSCSLLHLAL